MDGTRILVVEDNGDDLLILERLLSRVGGDFQVAGAQTGAEAIDCLRRQPWDLAFVDQHLPDVRGEVLISQLKEVDPTLPVVVLTGRGDEQLAVNVMKAGAWDYLRKNDLSGPLLKRTLRAVQERARLEAQMRATQAELQEMAIRDGLTGLCNHRHFQSLLATEFARARRYGKPLACLMLDLDRFKRVNDTLGHPAGDEVLRHVAALLRAEAREVDVLARYGGEEFVLLLPNTDAEGALRAGERICRVVGQTPTMLGDRPLFVTLSVGAATDESTGVTGPSELVQRADEALYVAKRGGRNRVCLAGAEALEETPSGLRQLGRRASQALATVASLLERHEPGRAGHGERGAALGRRVARRLGASPEVEEAVAAAARLVGLGRLALPEAAWNTPSSLPDDERSRVRDSALLVEEILLQAGERELVTTVVRHHRERWDGLGGPDGLEGRSIPLGARILAGVDAWCSLTSERPWRPALSRGRAVAQLRADAGTVFDPQVVDATLAVVEGAPLG